MEIPDLGLYLLTGEDISAGRSTLEIVEKAIEGGVQTIQLREKKMSAGQLVRLGKKLRVITRENGVALIINDRVDVALAVGADGVHLGQDDFPIEEARKLLGNRAILGLSVDNVEEAVKAERAGADYVGLGPIYRTMTKTDTGPMIGPESIREVKDRIGIPVVAIGGIHMENAPAALRAGADSLAVITAVTEARDITGAARDLTNLIRQYGG
ncbi:MAG: thiamine phosphate synthase [Clostridia bacterium]|nr:thiamine phosphate synthase [Clostridia bacterium]